MFSKTHDWIGAIAKFIPEIGLAYPLFFFLSFFEAQESWMYICAYGISSESTE